MAITTIVMDVYKPGSELKNKVVDISDSFNARVGDNQVRLVVKYVERGIVERMEQEQLTPFMMGFVGQPDEEQKVTAETGIAVSYHGSSEDIIGGGKVRMDLPGTMFPQEGAFYGFFGLENSDGKRATTNNVFFRVENDNPDMYVDTLPFRTELQKLLDEATAKSQTTFGDISNAWEALKKEIEDALAKGNTDIDSYLSRLKLAEQSLEQYEKDLAAGKGISQGDLDSALNGIKDGVNNAVDAVTGGLTYLSNDMMTDVNGGYTDLQKLKEFKNSIDTDTNLTRIAFATDTHHEAESNWRQHMTSGLRHVLNPMYVQDAVDAVIFNGDNINNGGGGDKATANYLVQDFSTTVRSLVDSDTPVLINKGNHDNNYKDATVFDDARSLPSQILSNAELAHYFGYDVKDDRIVRDGNSAYCYIELPNNVRMYVLDSYDTPETLDKDGYLDFNARQNSIYGQKQLQWLANTLDVSKTTVLFAHNPVEQVFGTGNAGNEVNHDVLHQLLNAFVSGGNGTINGATGITVKYTFDKAGTIAGVFTGHLHKSSMVVDHTINYVQTTCQAVYADNDHQEERNNKFGTWQEDAFDVIEIDPVKKHVKLKRYGYGEDREYDY
ncbi:metallophosphoesterase family protein [Pediococcus pentosaceus]|uniref:metallophosphoesterase family protein n=1 Tax=Pediococcus pentosaceus TaxID=1255 RepID=UPI0011B5020F|nr:metallophosphoesterase [Pediococcus pentosaceus]QDZ69400.1 hypothetical protein PSL001_00070 [Pediococcus pentosaceus]